MKEFNKWDRFWRLSIIKEVERDIWNNWSKYRKFLCYCDCWIYTKVRLKKLIKWDTKSCWCLRKDILKKRITTHWMTWTKIYYVYNELYKRCNNLNHTRYKDYGWRWIKCEWNTFDQFYKDMWDDYKEWLSIERIDNNWNYCKNNCRWATMKEQARNTRQNIKYEWKCLKEWSEMLWLKYTTLYMRIKRGTKIEDIINNIKNERITNTIKQ